MAHIGIYGGSFNPPHIGHMLAAGQAYEALKLDRLLLIPAGMPPHKRMPEGTPRSEQRLEMLRIAAKMLPSAEVSDMEIRRQGVSYTYETVLQLRHRYPTDRLTLIMGTDMLLSFQDWKNPDIITNNAQLAVMYRGNPGEKMAVDQVCRQMAEKGIAVTKIENSITEISSTQLRRMLIFACAAPFLPEGVETYVRKEKLYGTAENYRNLPMEKLEPVVVSLLDPRRVAHVLGCRDTAVKLAKRWGADTTDAARAGILHDITKALDGQLQLTLCREYATILDEFSEKYPKTIHALTGSLVAERIFGENAAVVSAIRYHTTGKADMNLLEKIVYIADYIEPNRTLPGVEELRALADTDLDAAVLRGLEMTLDHLRELGDVVSPESKNAIAWLRKEKREC